MQDPPASASLVLGFQTRHQDGLKAAHILFTYVWPQFKILNVFKVLKKRKTEWVALTLGFDLSTMDFFLRDRRWSVYLPVNESTCPSVLAPDGEHATASKYLEAMSPWALSPHSQP